MIYIKRKTKGNRSELYENKKRLLVLLSVIILLLLALVLVFFFVNNRNQTNEVANENISDVENTNVEENNQLDVLLIQEKLLKNININLIFRKWKKKL